MFDQTQKSYNCWRTKRVGPFRSRAHGRCHRLFWFSSLFRLYTHYLRFCRLHLGCANVSCIRDFLRHQMGRRELEVEIDGLETVCELQLFHFIDAMLSGYQSSVCQLQLGTSSASVQQSYTTITSLLTSFRFDSQLCGALERTKREKSMCDFFPRKFHSQSTVLLDSLIRSKWNGTVGAMDGMCAG